MAAYFGDTGGNAAGFSLAVDQYGYIYIHGNSNSPTFGGQNSFNNPGVTNEYTWLYAKTHWDMTYEVQCDKTSVASGLC
jgi:hypothetical protein